MVTLMRRNYNQLDVALAPGFCLQDTEWKHAAVVQSAGMYHLVMNMLMCLLILCNINRAAAQTENIENQVKAAFLYKFPTYVEWPAASFAEPTSPVVFGMYDADQLADELLLLSRDRLLDGRAVTIRKLQPGDSTAGLHVLFIGQSRTRTSEKILAEALANSILTVTEAPVQRPDGSIINFAIIDDRVRFDVSLVMAEQAGLTVSSRLLQVALKVIEPSP